VFYLRKHRNPEYSRTTRAALSRILKVSGGNHMIHNYQITDSGLQVTVETGIPCSVFTIVNLCLYTVYSVDNYHLGICIFLSKVYSNSIMVVCGQISWQVQKTINVSLSKIMNSRAHISHGPPANATVSTDMVFQSHSSPSAALQFAVATDRTISTDLGGNFMDRNVTDKRGSTGV
jgi:hypothetical protein